MLVSLGGDPTLPLAETVCLLVVVPGFVRGFSLSGVCIICCTTGLWAVRVSSSGVGTWGTGETFSGEAIETVVTPSCVGEEAICPISLPGVGTAPGTMDS